MKALMCEHENYTNGIKERLDIEEKKINELEDDT